MSSENNKINSSDEKSMLDELYNVIARLDNSEKVRLFLEDLCTRKELNQMSQRLLAAKLLNQGLTYTQVMDETTISSTTLSRVSQALQYGEGYKLVL